MSLSTFIYSFWFFVLSVGVVLIITAMRAGWGKYRSLKFWRMVKLGASLLGIVGVALLMFNFELTARALVVGKARDELLLYFFDTKSYIAASMAKTCSETTLLPDRKVACWDMKNIDGQINIINIRNNTQFSPILNWQKNPDIDDFIKSINDRIIYMNSLVPSENDRNATFSEDGRMYMYVVAALLLILAVSGSVGEASYQLREASDNAKKDKA